MSRVTSLYRLRRSSLVLYYKCSQVITYQRQKYVIAHSFDCIRECLATTTIVRVASGCYEYVLLCRHCAMAVKAKLSSMGTVRTCKNSSIKKQQWSLTIRCYIQICSRTLAFGFRPRTASKASKNVQKFTSALIFKFWIFPKDWWWHWWDIALQATFDGTVGVSLCRD